LSFCTKMFRIACSGHL